MAEVTGPGVDEMRLLAAQIRDADPKLRRQLRKRMRDAAGPVVDKVKASIGSMPSHHDGTLRREIAGTVAARVSFARTGVRLEITSYGARMPEGKANLPAETDRASGWGHPVFERKVLRRARKNWTWVRQHGKTSWFEQPIGDSAKDLRAAVEAAMDDAAREIG